MLKAINLSYKYNFFYLFRELSFDLMPSEVLWVKGNNGSGKSTLLKILASLISPSEGILQWKKDNYLNNLSAYRANLAYLGHKNALHSDLTVIDNINLLAEQKSCQLGLLRKFNLLKYRYSIVKNLSAGQQRKLAFVILLNKKAKLWLLDEPFVCLDRDAVEKVTEEIVLHTQQGGVLVITSHNKPDLLVTKVLTLSES